MQRQEAWGLKDRRCGLSPLRPPRPAPTPLLNEAFLSCWGLHSSPLVLRPESPCSEISPVPPVRQKVLDGRRQASCKSLPTAPGSSQGLCVSSKCQLKSGAATPSAEAGPSITDRPSKGRGGECGADASCALLGRRHCQPLITPPHFRRAGGVADGAPVPRTPAPRRSGRPIRPVRQPIVRQSSAPPYLVRVLMNLLTETFHHPPKIRLKLHFDLFTATDIEQSQSGGEA